MRVFLSLIFIFFISFNALASVFDKMTSEQINQISPVQFRQGISNITPELFGKLTTEQKIGIENRAVNMGLKLPEVLKLPPQVNTFNELTQSTKTTTSTEGNLKGMKPPISQVNTLKVPFQFSKTTTQVNNLKRTNSLMQLSFNYASYEKMLHAIMEKREIPAYEIETKETPVFERDIPLSREYEKLEETKKNDSFYQTSQNFDFKRDFMVFYNNDAYWKGLNKERPKSDLIEGINSFPGKPITSEWKDSVDQVHFDPVGYHLYLPKDPSKTQAIIVVAYGGEEKTSKSINDFGDFYFPPEIARYLLSQNIGIMVLDTIDQLENTVYQGGMDKELFFRLLENVKSVFDLLSSPSKAKLINEKLGNLPSNLPLYGYGGSFGGTLFLRFMEEFFGKVKINGIITFNGFFVPHSAFQDYVVPFNYLEKLKGNTLIFQNYNDNNVTPDGILRAYKKIQELGKADLFKLVFFPEGNLEADINENVGHGDSEKILYKKRMAMEIYDFIQKTKKGVFQFSSPLNDMRYFYNQIAYNQHQKNSSFKDRFLSVAFKIYQNSLHERATASMKSEKPENSFMKDWFDTVSALRLSQFKDYGDFLQTALKIQADNIDIKLPGLLKKLKQNLVFQDDSWDRVYFPILLKFLINEIVEGRYRSDITGEPKLKKLEFSQKSLSMLCDQTIKNLLKSPSTIKNVTTYRDSFLEGFFFGKLQENTKNPVFVFKNQIKMEDIKDKKLAILFLYNLFTAYKKEIPYFEEMKQKVISLLAERKRQLKSVGRSQVMESATLLKNNSQLKEEYHKVPIPEILQLEIEAIKYKKVFKIKELADKYYNGTGIQINYQKAAKLYEAAANLNNVFAMNKLGDMYRTGLGVEQNYEKAMVLYQKAANKGNVAAMKNIENMYFKGEGVEQSNEKARYWQQRAKELEDK